MKKYEFTGVTKSWIEGKTLHQIRAVRDFGDVHVGDIGGFIEKEDNLSHDGNAWIEKHAIAYGDCRVYGDSRITGHSMVSGESRVYGNAAVGGQAHVKGNAWICGNARIKTSADYISISGLGDYGNNITAFLDGDGEIVIVSTDFNGGVSSFLALCAEKHSNSTFAAVVFELTELIKLHFRKR